MQRVTLEETVVFIPVAVRYSLWVSVWLLFMYARRSWGQGFSGRLRVRMKGDVNEAPRPLPPLLHVRRRADQGQKAERGYRGSCELECVCSPASKCEWRELSKWALFACEPPDSSIARKHFTWLKHALMSTPTRTLAHTNTWSEHTSGS